MQTINDIIFDQTIYSQADHWPLILYQLNGTSIAIPLPNANLMSFINPFDNITLCQTHIDTNNQKRCTLFGYSKNIETWIRDSNVLPINLNEINIFCSPEDRAYIRSWSNRFRQIRNITRYDQLNRDLLLFGIAYIRRLRGHFQHDEGIRNLLNQDIDRMRSALSNGLWQAVTEQDENIRLGVENVEPIIE